MRLLRLDLSYGGGSLDLHPYLSVLQRLDASQQAELSQAVVQLVNNDGSGVRGLIETEQGLVELKGIAIPRGMGPLTTENVVVDIDDGDTSDVAAMQSQLDQLRKRAKIDAVAVEMIRADLDPAAAARLQHLRRFQNADGEASIDPRVASRVAKVRQALSVVESQTPTLIESAPGIAELLERWRAHVVAKESARTHLDSMNDRISLANSELASAEIELIQAEAEAVPVILSAEEEARLEFLANPLEEGRRKNKPRERTEAEEDELNAILNKVSLPTFTAYAMYRLSPTPPPEKQAALHACHAKVARAKADVEEAKAELSIDPQARNLEIELAALKEEVAEIMGAVLPEDLGSALEAQVTERENPHWIEALSRLYDALQEVDAGIPETMEPEDLPKWAQDWADVTEVRARESAGVAPEDLPAQIELAERSLRRHAKAMARIDHMDVLAEGAAARVEQLEQQIRHTESGGTPTAEQILEQLVPLLERINSQSGVSVPVVVKGEFPDLDGDEVEALLYSLEAFTQHFQIIVLTDRVRAHQWAKSVGLERAVSVS